VTSSQTCLPGCAPAPTANRATLENDLRGEVALAILAWLAWSDSHCDARRMLDGSIAAWLTAGKPDDSQISRSLVKLRSMLARFIDHGGAVPSWFPPSLLKAINTPWCAHDLAPSADKISAAAATTPTTGNAPTTISQRCAGVAILPENSTETDETKGTRKC